MLDNVVRSIGLEARAMPAINTITWGDITQTYQSNEDDN